jgi:UDP-2-acetamido-2-deoxy-ribo-hexuluronate aminotransferase
MKFTDLATENSYFQEQIQNELKRVYESGVYLLGPQLEKLEKTFANHIGMNHAVGVKNCTDAIMMLVKHHLKNDMPIILPNFGAYPTSVACRNFTDNIHYVDVDETMTINPNKLPDVKNGIIIPVHLFGNNCQIDKIKEYCKLNNHVLIEDCAQSTGSGSGKDGDYSVFSFYPTKPLGCMGDGGMICLNDQYESEYFKKFRFYGQSEGKIHFAGINSRMDETQSSIVLAKISSYQSLNEKRIQIAKRYKNIIKGYKTNGRCVYHIFSLMFNNRDKIIKLLNEKEIPYMIHYQHHVNELPALRGKISSSVGFRVADKILSIPCHPFLKEEEIQKIEEFLFMVKDEEYVL